MVDHAFCQSVRVTCGVYVAIFLDSFIYFHCINASFALVQECSLDKEGLERLTGLADQLVASGDYCILSQHDPRVTTPPLL